MNDDKGFKREDYEFYLDSKRPRAAVVSGPESQQKPVSIDRELARDRSVSSTKKSVPATRKKKQVSNDKQIQFEKQVASIDKIISDNENEICNLLNTKSILLSRLTN